MPTEREIIRRLEYDAKPDSHVFLVDVVLPGGIGHRLTMSVNPQIYPSIADATRQATAMAIEWVYNYAWQRAAENPPLVNGPQPQPGLLPGQMDTRREYTG